MSNKPKKWLAVLLCFFMPPFGMMYVAQIKWAGVYFLLALAVGAFGGFYFHDSILAGVVSIIFILICVIHTYHLAAKYPEERTRPAYSRWYGLLSAGLGWIFFVIALRSFVVEPFRIPAGSMLPTLPVGSHLIAKKWGYGNYGTYGIHLFHRPISAPLTRGDLVVFDFPPRRSDQYVKRLIGLPGDKIVYRKKQLSINGNTVPIHPTGDHVDLNGYTYLKYVESLMGTEYTVLIDEGAPPFILKSVDFPFQELCTYDAEGVACNVPAGHYFFMGDNRDNSNDSRMWSFVPADHIVGKVIYIFQ